MIEYLSNLSHRIKRRRVIRGRRQFFQLILKTMSAPTDKVGLHFGQDAFYTPIGADAIMEPEFGTLYIPVNAVFYGLACHHAWSLYQTGDRFRVAVILSGDLAQAPLIDWKHEIADMWPGVSHKQLDRTDLTLHEWSFNDRSTYTDPITQDGFALNLRHSQIRMLRIIHDYALLKTKKP